IIIQISYYNTCVFLLFFYLECVPNHSFRGYLGLRGDVMTITSDLMSDMISPELLDDFQQLNEEQRKIVINENGPVMFSAGPGSSKTRCLTLRAMNLLLLKKA